MLDFELIFVSFALKVGLIDSISWFLMLKSIDDEQHMRIVFDFGLRL
jgi:hypothetical protein